MKNLIVFGLGYVGLPLSLALAKKRNVIGYDNDANKIQAYQNNNDPSGECKEEDFYSVKNNIVFTDSVSCLKEEKIVIVTVPTPVDEANTPDLNYLRSATETIGNFLRKGDLIIYESTVFPGATEEFCVPILENISKLKHLNDFNVGYSPERINPGDKTRSLGDVVKVISGDTEDTLCAVEEVYAPIINAGIHRAQSIKVAETAKVIENTQRDTNIALMNELSIICDNLDINTLDVIDAAKTKWNFLPFVPGLVGGHCIGVDPYYLTHIAQKMGYYPEMILSGRRINESMPSFLASKLVKKLIANNLFQSSSSVLIMGMTFKENVTDLRNSKSFVLKECLESYGLKIETWDTMAKENSLISYTKTKPNKLYDAVVLAAPHDEFISMYNYVESKLLNKSGIIVDIKGTWKDELSYKLGERYITL